MSEIKYVQVGVQGPAGPSAHGDLSGLDDDDHPQYINEARGDARYTPIAHAGGSGVHAIASVTGLQTALDGKATIANGVTNGDSHDHSGGDGAAIAYANVTGTPTLGTSAELDYGTSAGNTVILDGLARLPAVDGSQLVNLPGGGVTDHGALTGLADDDHSQYHNNARGDARYSVLAHDHAATYAPIAKGVTNGDTHDHSGGDGAQIAYASLSGLPTLGTAAATDSTAYDAAGAASTAQAAAIAASTPVAHASNTSNPHSVTKSQVGLGNCDNTSDANKPVSTAQATADTAIGTAAASDATTKANAAQAAAIAACPAETTTTIGSLINGATAKSVIVGADKFGISDSAASGVLKQLSLDELIAAIQPSTVKNLSVCGIPLGLLPGNGSSAGLQFTGTRGVFSLSAAIMTNVWNILQGMYCYFPANFGGQTISAGFYWVQMTSDTAGEVFNNTYSTGIPSYQPSPTAFGNLSGWLTQVTSEVTSVTGITVPANSLGLNGILRSLWKQISTSSAGFKTVKLKLGSTSVAAYSASTSFNDSDCESIFQNAGIATRQVNTRTANGMIGGNQTTYSADSTSVDTTSALTISWTLQINTNTDALFFVPRQISTVYG
jgi:hypothetical protein